MTLKALGYTERERDRKTDWQKGRHVDRQVVRERQTDLRIRGIVTVNLALE